MPTCPVCDLDFLPVEPLEVRCAGGDLVFDLVATGGDEVRAVMGHWRDRLRTPNR